MNKNLQTFFTKAVSTGASSMQRCYRLLLMMVLMSSFAFTVNGQIGIDFRQFANNANPNKWINSILQQNNSAYYEGTSVPQRLVFVGVPTTTGNQHTLLLSHQTLKGSVHAYDFITGYDQALADYLNISTNALVIDVSGANIGPEATTALVNSLYLPGKRFNATPTPSADYGNHGGDNVASRVSAYDVVVGGSTKRSVQLYGSAPITAASLVFLGYNKDAVTGDDYANYELRWTSASSDILILMAGHLSLGPANSNYPGVNYGIGRGSSAISGGPYHFKLERLDGVSLGAQDNQIKGSDILTPPPPCTITPSTNTICANANPFSVQYSGPAGMTAYAWTITPSTGVTTNGLTSQNLVITGAPAGSYTIKLVTTLDGKQSVDNCTASLTVNQTTSSTQSRTICSNLLPYTWDGLTFTEAGTQTKTGLTNAAGCDSTATYTITVKLTSSSTQSRAVCSNLFPYTWDGLTFADAGTQTKTGLTNAAGCDSTATYTVTKKLTTSSTQSRAVCSNLFPYTWDGLTFADAGTQTKTGLTNAAGCDSTATYTVTKKLTSSSTQSRAVCSNLLPYTWDGLTFTEAGTQTKTGLTNVAGCDSIATYNLTVNPNPSCEITARTNAPICLSEAQTSVERVYASVNTASSYKWTVDGNVSIKDGIDDQSTVTLIITGAGNVYLTVTNEFECTSNCSKVIGTLNPAPCTISGPEKVCANTEAVYSAGDGGVEYLWSIEGDATILSAQPYGSSITVKAGAAGSYKVKLTINNGPLACPSDCEFTTTVESCSKPLCTYTQGYYGNSTGTSCTPNGSSNTFNLIKNSIMNMPGGQLELGLGLRRFIATSSNTDVNRIITIMPGGGSAAVLTSAGAIPGYWTPSTLPVSNQQKIRNVLLSQSIALALNVYMPNSQLGSFSLAGAGGSADLWMVTVAKTGDCSSLADAVAKSCTYAPKYECVTDPTVITGYTTTYNPYQAFMIPANVINALPGDKTVADLLKFASDALGGATLPTGVSLSNINAAVDAINRGFDECRIFVEFKANSTVTGYCVPPAPQTCPEPLITANSGYGRPGVNAASESNVQVNTQPQIVNVKDVTINAYPNPFRDVVNFRFISPAKGRATLELFTVYGQRLGVLFDGDVNAGTYNFVKYDKINAGNNMLIYKLTVNGKVITGKVQSAR